MRPAGKARGVEHTEVFERQATQPEGTQGRANAKSFPVAVLLVLIAPRMTMGSRALSGHFLPPVGGQRTRWWAKELSSRVWILR